MNDSSRRSVWGKPTKLGTDSQFFGADHGGAASISLSCHRIPIFPSKKPSRAWRAESITESQLFFRGSRMQLKPFLLDAWLDQFEHNIEFNLAASTGPVWTVNDVL